MNCCKVTAGAPRLLAIFLFAFLVGVTLCAPTAWALTAGELPCTLIRASGNAQYATQNHMTDTAFDAGEVDTVIVASADLPVVGAAAGGLAGVRGAPIVTTGEEGLSVEAKRTLSLYEPSSVLLVGFSDASIVSKQVTQASGANVTVSNAFVGATPGQVSYKVYSRTKRSGYWDAAPTALVAPASSVPAASLAGTWAYRAKSPVFLADEPALLPDESANAIAAGGFGEVVVVGMSEFAAGCVERQLRSAGFKGVVRCVAAADPYRLSVAVAKELAAKGLTSCDKATVVSAFDDADAVTAASTCGKNASPLLFADDSDKGAVAVSAYLEPNKEAIKSCFLFGVRGYLSEGFYDRLVRLWSTKSSDNLAWGSISVDRAEYPYDGSAHTPVAYVRDSAGALLREGRDYSLVYYANATDRVVDAVNIVAAGGYTLVAQGMGSYSGSCGVSFTVFSGKLSDAEVRLASRSFAYNGGPVVPEVDVRLDGVQLKEGMDYRLACERNVDAGTASLSVKGCGSYVGSRESTYAIRPLDIASLATLSLASSRFTYDGKAHKPQISVDSALPLANGRDYVVSMPKAVKAGSYSVTVSGKGNFAGALSGAFKVGKAAQKIKTAKNAWRFKAKTLKRSGKSFSLGAKAGGKLSFAVAGSTAKARSKAKAALSVNKKGKVTVRKGAAKGVYRISVKAAATKNYRAAVKTIKVVVK